MTTRAPLRLPLLAPLAVVALLAGCGDSLYDAEGVALVDDGSNLTCNELQTSCAGVCTDESPAQCGAACEDCTLRGAPPEGATVACVGFEGPGFGQCGFECAGGLLQCDGACCGSTALSAGTEFTCALAQDGTVHCFGANAVGQLGDGGVADRFYPMRVPGLEGATALGAGVEHACAVLVSGAVRCWGRNEHGQVSGNASSAPVTAPAATPVAASAIAVAGGGTFTCALLATGAVQCWGDLGRIGGATPVASGATALDAGTDHVCAVVGGGRVECFGSNLDGQLGVDPQSTSQGTPIAAGATRIVAGANQTCAATGTGANALRCWGASVGAAYRLAEPQRTPATPMRDAERATIEDLVTLATAGARHVCVGKAAAGGGTELECLGDNASGQLGGPVEPGHEVPLVLPAPVTAVAAGDAHTCAALSDGRLRCWGANGRGQLGDGTNEPRAVGVLVAPTGR